MSKRRSFKLMLATLFSVYLALPAFAHEAEIQSWTAPPYWAPPASATGPNQPHGRTAEGRQGLSASPTALPFISLPPCRLVDTRGNGAPLTGGFLPSATVRTYTLAGVCGVPANAQAISLNATAVKPTGPGFLVLYPEGGTFPPVSTLNFLGNDVIVNAAVVPLSATGGIAVALGVSGGDVLLDTNGYYAAVPSVTSLNTQTGDLTLTAGTNVSITPSGNTLTIASTGGPGGTLPAGTADQTLRNDGAGAWVASSAMTDNGSEISIARKLTLPATIDSTIGVVNLAGGRFLHAFGSVSTFLGSNAGNFTMTGVNNTGVGQEALSQITTGNANTAVGGQVLSQNTNGAGNTAVGSQAMLFNSSGFGNTATGANVLVSNTTGGYNTASGFSAMITNSTGNFNTAVGYSALEKGSTGDENTATGAYSLDSNKGSHNTAVGYYALQANTTGAGNVAIGHRSGQNLTTGDNNLCILHPGVAGDANVLRIGFQGVHAAAYIAGIYGATSALGTAVFVNSNGQLGTTTSSRRYKEDITDVGDASDVLMKLRPVSFLYTPDLDETRTPQYGLIAEEVGEVAPNLVLYGKDGRPETVRYHFVNAMLLNEVQKSRREIDDLKIRLARLEEALAGGRGK